MCFNPLMTWATAGLGISIGILAKKKNKSSNLYLPPAYFGCMEILQGLMYWELDHPSAMVVNILVYLAYVHVCFQPLVINYWLGAFINQERKAVYLFTLKLCFIGGLLLLTRMLLTKETPLCLDYETLCSAQPNVFNGLYHVAWSLPLIGGGWNYVTPSIALHFFLFFIPGALLGFYRLMFVFFILGPYLAAQITSNPSEQSSIWCMMGLWLIVMTILAALYKLPPFFFPNKQG